MTPERDYLSILSNLSRHAPLDLDPILFDTPPGASECQLAQMPFPPSPDLWDMPDDGPSRIGIRITAPIHNEHFLASRLASIARERHIFPVFLSHIGKSGMHRFGFRVEQIGGVDVDARFQFEIQVTRFWRLALIVDANEIDNLR